MVNRRLNLANLLGSSNSAFLFGPRGVGKTRLANEYIKQKAENQILIYNLLEYQTFQKLLKNPALLSNEISTKLKTEDRLFVLIDEIQKVPSLLDEVHSLIETHKGKLQFLLTGSSARKLKREGANLLAGRALNLKLHPISFIEDQNLVLDDVLRLGSLPGVIYNNSNPPGSLRSYVETYLKEEIQQEALVRNLEGFSKFIEIAGQYHGQIINASTIAKYAGISTNTVIEYFQILEDTLLGWRIYGWSASTKKQLRTAPKFYLFDNGVCNALRGELNVELKPQTSRYGNLFEGFIIQEFIRLNHYLELDFKFSYWKAHTKEVDLIISRGAGEPIAGIEIKSAELPEKKDLSGLKAFQSDYPKARLFCVSKTKNELEIAGISVLPWQSLPELIQGF